MHDLLHNLAQYVSKQECVRYVGDEISLFLEIPKTVRHLSIESSNLELLKEVGRFKNLRTLLLSYYNKNFVDTLTEMFKVSRSIRLLHINDFSELEVVPENIGYLHHLRYLRFPIFSVKLLPISLSSLYHLQFLTTKTEWRQCNCCNDCFPSDSSNFSNLRYLSRERLNFPTIAKLKYLQQVEEREHTNDLEDANVILCDERKLRNLFLNRIHSEAEIACPELEEMTLDNHQPHKLLNKLWIFKYMGARSAKWMNEAHLINNLQEINITRCLEWEILPPFGQLPFLKTLWLDEMPKLKRIENKFHGNDMCSVFPSLETLCFEHLGALVDWFDASVVGGLFPRLTKLYIYHCPNLRELSYLPPKLKSLEIENIGWNTLKFSNSIALEVIDVRHCPNITSISLVGEMNKLRKLIFEDLQSLQSIPSSLTNVSSLEIMELNGLPQRM